MTGFTIFGILWAILFWAGRRYLLRVRTERKNGIRFRGALSLAIEHGGMAGALFFWALLVAYGSATLGGNLLDWNIGAALANLAEMMTYVVPVALVGGVMALLVGGFVGAIAITVDAGALKITRIILARNGLAMGQDEVPF